MPFATPRTANFWLASAIPAGALAFAAAALIHPTSWAIAGLASVVGTSAYVGELQRRSTDIPPPRQFIGS